MKREEKLQRETLRFGDMQVTGWKAVELVDQIRSEAGWRNK